MFLLANKIDLLPRDLKRDRVGGWLKRYIRKRLDMHLCSLSLCMPLTPRSYPALSKKICGVHLISAKSGDGVREALKRIDQMNQDKRDIFVIGVTNAGKSTFVNRYVCRQSHSHIHIP